MDVSTIHFAKIIFSNGNDEKIQTSNCVKTFAYGTNNKIIEKNEKSYQLKNY